MLNKHEPLGLPRGSVRAILALALTAVACYLATVNRLSSEQFVTLVTLALGFYFVKRDDVSAQNTGM